MTYIKPIQTVYNGLRFRSRLQARWAVFFDACGVEWEYEAEGYDIGNGLWYLPDFLLHGVQGRAKGDIYVEVKGHMTQEDSNKIRRFYELGKPNKDQFGIEKSDTAILVVGNIPRGEDLNDIDYDIFNRSQRKDKFVSEFSFECIDGDCYPALPGVNKHGGFELFGYDINYTKNRDDRMTEYAYKRASQARFEHGEQP